MSEIIQQRRQMKMHPRLLWDVIHRQAGTLGKAILEGVMNSVDAGATHCEVTIDRDSFSISDDGKGFASDEEIDKYFETFGYPHAEGDAVYGRFRMGRGQIMSFGSSHWETNNYRMDVDFRPQKDQDGNEFALGYDFSKVAERVKGCSVRVDLYDKLSPSALDAVKREIVDYVKYVSIPVKLNGKVISADPAEEKWDLVTPDAYIKFKSSGTLDVYNQGVLVCKMYNYRYGVSGVVVSKEALDVNFARNDVQSSCPRWKRIVKVLRDRNMEEAKRNAPLTDAQRDFYARQLATGEAGLDELKDARIVTDVTNSHHKISVFQRLDNFHHKVTIARRGDRVAEMAHTRKICFVVSDECAERFDAQTPEELVVKLTEILKRNGTHCPSLIPVEREDLDAVISSSHEPIADKELNKPERLALKALRKANETMFYQARYYDRSHSFNKFDVTGDKGKLRKISVGLSQTADAWTDGTDNIWIERRNLRLVKEGHKGMLRLAALMLHEYLHNGPSTGTHDHGVEFYERFHDIALDSNILASTADVMLRTVLKELRGKEQHITQQYTRFEDNVVKAAELGIGSYEAIDPDAEDNLPAPATEPVPMSADAVSLPASSVRTEPERRRSKTVAEEDRQLTFSL